MRENYRNSIASIKKFPQFTTMHVIDGQAGLIICASLIFCSLTIDNILNIIVLLILAGVSITMITGNNSILDQATSASRETTHANVYEQLQLKAAEYYLGKNSGDVTEGTLIAYLQSGSKPIISEELGEGSGKYQIYVENLLGTTPIYGKGTASGSDTSTYKDVYILEKVESPEGASINNTKIASTKPIRIAANSQESGQSINYTVK